MRLEPFHVSVLLAVLGLGIMQASSAMVDLRQTSIVEISRQDVGERVVVTGNVTEFHRSGDTAFMTVTDGPGSIQVVVFDSSTGFSVNDTVRVEGSVKLYEGELEIVADKATYSP